MARPLTAGSGGPYTLLHFFLAPAVELGRPAEAPAAVREPVLIPKYSFVNQMLRNLRSYSRVEIASREHHQ
jgi:hypothetical protein